MTDQTTQQRLEAAADDDGRLAVEDAVNITRAHVPGIDDKIREALERGDVSGSIQLKRDKHRQSLAEARAAADGGGSMTSITTPGPKFRSPKKVPSHIDAMLAAAPAPLPKLASERRDLRERVNAAKRDLDELEGRQPSAESEDRQAHAEAVRAGQSDPGPRAVEALADEISAAGRDHQALHDALETVTREFVHELRQARGKQWAEALRKDRDAHAGTAIDTLARAAAAVEEVERILAAETWLSEVQEEGRLSVAAKKATINPRDPSPGAPVKDRLLRIRTALQQLGDQQSSAN
jgi:hypothetical protein